MVFNRSHRRDTSEPVYSLAVFAVVGADGVLAIETRQLAPVGAHAAAARAHGVPCRGAGHGQVVDVERAAGRQRQGEVSRRRAGDTVTSRAGGAPSCREARRRPFVRRC